MKKIKIFYSGWGVEAFGDFPSYQMNLPGLIAYSPGPGGEHHMDICGEGKNPDLTNLLALGEKAGLERKKCKEVINQVLEVASGFEKEAKNWPLQKSTLLLIHKSITANMKRLTK